MVGGKKKRAGYFICLPKALSTLGWWNLIIRGLNGPWFLEI